MHSRIFQITTTCVDKKHFLNECTLLLGDSTELDYCSEIDEEDRKWHIEYLVNKCLPEGMFELVSENTIRYKGGVEQWLKEDYVSIVHRKAAELTAENALDWQSAYKLKEAVMNPLDIGYRFYMDDFGCQTYSDQSYEFMRFLIGLEPGTILYICGVIDYHL